MQIVVQSLIMTLKVEAVMFLVVDQEYSTVLIISVEQVVKKNL